MCHDTLKVVKDEISNVRLRKALSEIMKLCGNINKYIDLKEPWKLVKSDKEKASEVIWVCMTAINCLKILFNPYIPFSSNKLNKILGFSDDLIFKWKWSENDLPINQEINPLGPLFKKIEVE